MNTYAIAYGVISALVIVALWVELWRLQRDYDRALKLADVWETEARLLLARHEPGTSIDYELARVRVTLDMENAA